MSARSLIENYVKELEGETLAIALEQISSRIKHQPLESVSSSHLKAPGALPRGSDREADE